MSYTEMSKKNLLWLSLQKKKRFFLLLEIGADFCYWKLVRARARASPVLSRTFRQLRIVRRAYSQEIKHETISAAAEMLRLL